MTSTLSDRLRARASLHEINDGEFASGPDTLCLEAAAAIDTLTRERDEARRDRNYFEGCAQEQEMLGEALVNEFERKLTALEFRPLPSGDGHASDCATHNMPAMPNGPCDCKPDPDDWIAWATKEILKGAVIGQAEGETRQRLFIMDEASAKEIATALAYRPQARK